MHNSMSKLSQQFKEIRSLLGVNYKILEMNGKDQKGSCNNERGYTKAVRSDFIRVFNSIDRTYSFSFAFNNPDRADGGGVIVSAQVKKDQPYLRSYLKFDEFKTLLNSLVKEMKLVNNSSDRLDYPKMHEMVNRTFSLKVDALNFDPLVDQLLETLKPIEIEYESENIKFHSYKNKIKNAKANKSKEDFEVVLNEMREELKTSTDKMNELIDTYEKSIRSSKESLMKDHPYVSSRLLGHIISPRLNLKQESALKNILLNELDAQPEFVANNELYND